MDSIVVNTVVVVKRMVAKRAEGSVTLTSGMCKPSVTRYVMGSSLTLKQRFATCTPKTKSFGFSDQFGGDEGLWIQRGLALLHMDSDGEW